MSNGQIFISYRRDDSAGYARALYDRLVQYFSKERVFMDVDGSRYPREFMAYEGLQFL